MNLLKFITAILSIVMLSLIFACNEESEADPIFAVWINNELVEQDSTFFAEGQNEFTITVDFDYRGTGQLFKIVRMHVWGPVEINWNNLVELDGAISGAVNGTFIFNESELGIRKHVILTIESDQEIYEYEFRLQI